MSQDAAHTADIAPVLVAGQWRASQGSELFQAVDPRTRKTIPGKYPISPLIDLLSALGAASQAAAAVRRLSDPSELIAGFLDRYADEIENHADALVSAATMETALPVSPRLRDVELPRTTGQLRQAAIAAREGSWRRPIIDRAAGLRSCLAPIGPVWILGPNNFPFAFNAISGGDFAAAIAAGNPVIAKAHPLHPKTSRLLAEAAHAAAADLPSGMVQMIYHCSPEDGLRMIADHRLRAVAFTGGRPAGLKLKAAADAAGKLFFGEMSSINPTVILPGALHESSPAIVEALVGSILMGCGQFCTKPGLILLLAGSETDAFIGATAQKLSAAPAGMLFSESGLKSMEGAIETLRRSGADVLTGGKRRSGDAISFESTLLRVDASQFLRDPQTFQTEAFGNAAMIVVARDLAELLAVLELLEGNLTGTIYSAKDPRDDAMYAQVAAALRPKVGRLLNDKMPTGVAVSPAMQHGGPFPASSQPHFSAVGIPGSILRFTQLEAYDHVRPHRLPLCLQDRNPNGRMWRLIDGQWTRADVGA